MEIDEMEVLALMLLLTERNPYIRDLALKL